MFVIFVHLGRRKVLHPSTLRVYPVKPFLQLGLGRQFELGMQSTYYFFMIDNLST